MRKKEFKPIELIGYRKSTVTEHIKITELLKQEFKSNRVWGIASIIVTLFFAIAIPAGLLVDGLIKEKIITQLLFVLVASIFTWTIFAFTCKGVNTNIRFERNIVSGNYVVLDCIPYWYYYNQEGRTEGSVKVQTLDGMPCIVNYVVDIETALAVEKDRREDIKMLLVFDRETQESRVFSENMLNRV